MNRQVAQSLDEQDSLSSLRQDFQLSEEAIYLCGHSLGAMPKKVVQQLTRVLHEQWGEQRIQAWTAAEWLALPVQLGKTLAPLLGVEAEDVIVADSVTVNLFKLLVAGMRLRPGRQQILTDKDNFPADSYMAAAVAELLPGVEVVRCARSELAEHLTERTAILMVTQADYRSSELYELKALAKLAHAAGALLLIDLSHSVGLMPLALREDEVDMAVGCGYKYLNGGPGAPAFIYVAKALQECLQSPLAGWMGHASPFDFEPDYRPAPGVRRFLCGTPAILSMSALATSLELLQKVSLAAIRHKAQALGEFMRGLMAEFCPRLQLLSPPEAERRGGHLAFAHSEAVRIERGLYAQGIEVDFRPPQVLRFGLSPLYVRFVDVYDTVQAIKKILGGGQ